MGNYETLWEKNLQFLWNPFTQMKDYVTRKPVIIESGEGVKLTDVEGKTYYDGNSSVWLNVHGHRNEAINEAIRRQLDKVAHSTLLGMANVPALELAEKLVAISPASLTRVFYSDSGSEAVEIALKMAFQYWRNKGNRQKNRFVTLSNGYHGDTIGAVSVGSIPLFHEVYRPLLFPSISTPFPYVYRHLSGDPDVCRDESLARLETVLQANHEEIAAVVVESMIQAAGGMITMPSGFMSGVRELCTRFDVLMLVDEVATGFGRTGKMFACEHEGVMPDIMTVAKGITGGYLPLAATLTSEAIYQSFYADVAERKTFYHGHSYTGNQLACAAALANLELMEKNQIIRQVQEKAEWLAGQWERFYDLSHVGDIRQLGLMAGIELVKDKSTKEEYPWQAQIGAEVTWIARDLGLLTRTLGNTIVFMPALVATREEMSAMLDIIYEAIKRGTEA